MGIDRQLRAGKLVRARQPLARGGCVTCGQVSVTDITWPTAAVPPTFPHRTPKKQAQAPHSKPEPFCPLGGPEGLRS